MKNEMSPSCIACVQHDIIFYFGLLFNLFYFIFQILASIITCTFYIVIGIALSFSAFFIPQVERPDSDLKVTEDESSWIASVIVLMGPVASISSGMIMERIGRLNTIKLAAIPAIVGWGLIAGATNVPMVIIGRILTGFGCGKLSPTPHYWYSLLQEIFKTFLDFSGWDQSCRRLHHRSGASRHKEFPYIGRTYISLARNGDRLHRRQAIPLANS